jgi:hypothetical protein
LYAASFPNEAAEADRSRDRESYVTASVQGESEGSEGGFGRGGAFLVTGAKQKQFQRPGTEKFSNLQNSPIAETIVPVIYMVVRRVYKHCLAGARVFSASCLDLETAVFET